MYNLLIYSPLPTRCWKCYYIFSFFTQYLWKVIYRVSNDECRSYFYLFKSRRYGTDIYIYIHIHVTLMYICGPRIHDLPRRNILYMCVALRTCVCCWKERVVRRGVENRIISTSLGAATVGVLSLFLSLVNPSLSIAV